MTNKKIFFLITSIIVTLFLLCSVVRAQELSMNVVVESDGSAIVLGSADINPGILGINFENKTLSGFTQTLTNKEGTNWIFNLNSSQSYQGYYAKVSLPSGAKLLSYSGTPSISSENGALILEFVGTENMNVNLVYTLEKVPLQINWLNLVILIILILLVVAVIILFLRMRKNKKEVVVKRVIKKTKKESKLTSIRKVLNQRENLIIDLLKKEGKTTQGKLQKLSGIPKASFSRHLNNLAKKSIVYKEGNGRLNIIRLKMR